MLINRLKKAIEEARQFVCKLNYVGVQVYFTAPGPNGEILIELKNTNSVEIIFIRITKVIIPF